MARFLEVTDFGREKMGFGLARQRLAKNRLRCARTIQWRRVEVTDTELKRVANGLDGAVKPGEAHGKATPHGEDGQALASLAKGTKGQSRHDER